MEDTKHALTPAAANIKLVIGLSQKDASPGTVCSDDVD